ncbi:MAG: DUF3017 domain-containing protein [Humibacillus sp.]|nr:DUF3017 domain-containing protein [Humibacillus sp.]MDN5777281.1 DUF3017 domain-containing protein [Humibacillus sp.]
MKLRGSGFAVLGVWWPVGVLTAAGVLTIGAGQIRLGGQIIGAALIVGAVVRLLAQPARRAGGLVVRSRGLDVVVLLALAIGVIIASATVNLDPSADRPPPRSVTR